MVESREAIQSLGLYVFRTSCEFWDEGCFHAAFVRHQSDVMVFAPFFGRFSTQNPKPCALDPSPQIAARNPD